MKIVEKKVWSKYFNDVLLGKKCFEIRQGDLEDIEVGDILNLLEVDEVEGRFTGMRVLKKISFIFRTREIWPQLDHFIVMGLEDVVNIDECNYCGKKLSLCHCGC